MKWQSAQLKQALDKNIAALPPLILIFGDDGGLVRKLAREAAAKVCPDNDPFMSDKITAEDLKNTPSLLQESAQTFGFGMTGGGRKLIQLDGNHLDANTQKPLTDAVKSYIEQTEIENNAEDSAIVVLTAAGMDAKQALVRAAEKNQKAAAVRCFLDANRDLSQVINEKTAQTGQKITPEAKQFLIDGLGRDRGITESELDKLILYTMNSQEITLEHCLEVIAAAPSVNIFKLCDAIGLRDKAQTDRLLLQLKHEGVEAPMMVAMVARHMRRLKTCHDMMAKEGHSPQQAMAKLRPPVFMDKDIFAAQLKRTAPKRALQNIDRLYTIQAQSRKGTADPDLIISRGILAMSA